jgi:hypothetical protein
MTRRKSTPDVEQVRSFTAFMYGLQGFPVVTPETVQTWLEEVKVKAPLNVASKLADEITKLGPLIVLPESPGLFPAADEKPVGEALWTLNDGIPKLLRHFSALSETLPHHGSPWMSWAVPDSGILIAIANREQSLCDATGSQLPA